MQLNKWAQLYTKGKGWRYFQLFNDICLIGAGGDSSGRGYYAGLLSYNINSRELNLISNVGHFNAFHPIDSTRCLACSGISSGNGNGVFLYESSSNTVSRIYDTGIR